MMKKTLLAVLVGLFMVMTIFVPSNVYAEDIQNTVNYTVRGEIYIWDGDYTDGVSSGTGIESDPYIIEGWEIDGSISGYGIIFDETNAYCIVRDCYIYSARDSGAGDSAGILLWISNNITIQNCTVEDCDIGISIDVSTNVNINRCYLDENGIEETGGGGGFEFTGVEIISSNNIVVSYNEILNDYSESIRIWNSYNCIIEYNTIFNSTEHGIDFSRAWDNIIRNNHISYCLNGLMAIGDSSGLMPVEYNMVYNNTLANNTERGIYLYNTENNTFYFNNFVGNGENVMEFNSILFNGAVYTNIWYSVSDKGNYWDDYTGFDTTGDGIGEEPYVITNETYNGVNLDLYPLVEPYNGTLPTVAPTWSEAIVILLIGILPFLILFVIFKKIMEWMNGAISNKKK